ncbi:DUF1909-domain-containing protein [Tilletiopsis washingtonensis]|uniref:DUF1909-domain-containing protein n=1 Tax=Tilletiopsis washingtonensis TaxID=58919 RepID=A0A316ZEW3_9BASI|nr:DUF1909-domain-containing protein [Tilletiopsis washingtonensis]PWO00060.1 DUF1909-domain-containing protein [Tilletiopsis washingtonensis]
MGNGNKANMKRERNAKNAAASEPKSQLKANQAALSVKCAVCMQTFMSTVRTAALQEHIDAKHPKKDVATCFPGFTGP